MFENFRDFQYVLLYVLSTEITFLYFGDCQTYFLSDIEIIERLKYISELITGRADFKVNCQFQSSVLKIVSDFLSSVMA